MEIDFENLGLKCGLEIHQQLDTRKLFCNCPSLLRKDEPDFKVKRKLHIVAGESGEVDIAAVHEASLEKEFTYEGYDTTCLV
jgi:glutamyl-tRNA(Gln) amidotransferase subunit E